jgi:hypothetical protein
MDERASKRVSALIASAISGLLGGCKVEPSADTVATRPACERQVDASTRDVPGPDVHDAAAAEADTPDVGAVDAAAGDSGRVVLSTRRDPALTFRSFLADCARRGGFVQTHATCSGNNACRGFSYNRFDRIVTEHTCRALNTCGGMSCVETAADRGRAAAILYASDCAGCHGEEHFTLYLEEGVSAEAATARFNSPARRAQQGALVAFGVQGHGGSESAPANMPGRWDAYSRAEILRLVDYIHTIPLRTSEMVILGLTHEVNPDGGDPVPLDASVPPG